MAKPNLTSEVSHAELNAAVVRAGLAGRAVCVHASLRSFGRVAGGPQAVVTAFLEQGCTLLVPAFTWTYGIPAPAHLRYPRNGWSYVHMTGHTEGIGRVYTPATQEIDADMGAVAAAVVNWPGRCRADHPIASFAALGPYAAELVAGQRIGDVFVPLARLAELDGFVVLMGVGLDNLTLLHLAEQRAGRVPFRRWANDAQGEAAAVDVGSCSDGFEQLAPALQPWERRVIVGASLWRIYPARQALDAAAAVIRANPAITHCENPTCERCNDAMAGGPILKDKG
jgi:aminoglycoside 3-N-acetyltransferase